MGQGTPRPSTAPASMGTVLDAESRADFDEVRRSPAFRAPLAQPPPPTGWLARIRRFLGGAGQTALDANDAAMTQRERDGNLQPNPAGDAGRNVGTVVGALQGLNGVMKPGRASPQAIGKLAVNAGGVIGPAAAYLAMGPEGAMMASSTINVARAHLDRLHPEGAAGYIGQHVATARNRLLGPSQDERRLDADLQLRARIAEERQAAAAAAPLDEQGRSTLAHLDAIDR